MTDTKNIWMQEHDIEKKRLQMEALPAYDDERLYRAQQLIELQTALIKELKEAAGVGERHEVYERRKKFGIYSVCNKTATIFITKAENWHAIVTYAALQEQDENIRAALAYSEKVVEAICKKADAAATAAAAGEQGAEAKQ